MKQIRHTLINQTEPLNQEEFTNKMTHIFEWANKMGREGKLVSHLDIQPKTVTCIEYVTDDDYAMMLNSGKIKETKDAKEEAPNQEEGAEPKEEGVQDTSVGAE